MKLKNKINISFIIIFFLVTSVIVFFFGSYTTNLVNKNINAYLISSNRARAEHIRTYIQEKETTSVILAAASVYRDLLKEPVDSSQYPIIKGKVDKRLQRTLEADPQINESFIIDSKGKVIASSDKTQEGKDKSKDSYFLNAKNGVYIKDVYYSDTLKRLNYTISAPAKDDNGAFLGVSVIRYLPASFFSIVKNENGLGDTEENFLVNKDKLFITPSLFLGEDVILKQKVDTENVRECFNPKEIEYVEKNGYSGVGKFLGNSIIENKDYRGVNVLATHAYIPETGWCLVTKADKSQLFSFQLALIKIFIVIFIIALLLFWTIGYFVSYKITNPISDLMKVISLIKGGDLSKQVKIESHDEIGQLGESFNDMTTKLKESYTILDEKVKDKTKELEEEKQSLDKKVTERTAELEKLKVNLEETVLERTEKLNTKLLELEKLNKLMVDRELKMIEMKKEAVGLKNQMDNHK